MPSAQRNLHRRSRARKTVIAGMILLFSLHVAMNLVLETIAPQWRDPEYGHRVQELHRLLEKNSSRSLIVVLGSSRVQMGFNPAELGVNEDTLVYNLSQAGCGPVHELLNLKRMIAAGIVPKSVLVEILPPVMGQRESAEKTLVQNRLSMRDLLRVAPYCESMRPALLDWFEHRLNPFSSYRLLLMSHLGLGSWLPWQQRQDYLWKQIRTAGWMPYFHESIPEEKRIAGLEVASGQYVPYFVDFAIAPTPSRAYADLLSLCQQYHISVAFFTMPESKRFREWYPLEVRQKLAAYYAELREQGVSVFDASTWFDDEMLFADGHHLMQHGSQAFSQRFGRDCLEPWLRSQ